MARSSKKLSTNSTSRATAVGRLSSVAAVRSPIARETTQMQKIEALGKRSTSIQRPQVPRYRIA